MRLLRLPLVLVTAGLALSLLSCGGGGNSDDPDATTQCSDGVDNDLDTLIDLADPDCADASDNDEGASGQAACMDGVDNDGDGKIDYPDDPGCLAPNQDSGENDDCPSGANCPACGNGVDDDGDGDTDFAGGDTGCEAAADDDEYSFESDACGAGTSVSNLPATGVISGVLQAGTGNLTAACGAGTVGTGPEVAYVVTVVRPVRLVASTDFPGTAFDSVLYLRQTCSDAATQLACSDDVVGGTRSTLSLDVQPGSYFLIVDGKTASATGAYTLVVNQYAGVGEACTDPDDCAPGFVCRAIGGAATTCELPVCSDNRDDDGDTLIDYPLDPGCTTPDDSTEQDTCPGAGCPECGNGLDDDGDGQTDYPDDVSCTSAAVTAEADCPIETDPILAVTSAVTSGTTVGATSQFAPTCGSSSPYGDRVHMLYLRAPLASLTIDTAGSDYDTVLALHDSLCTTELACDDDGSTEDTTSVLTRSSVAAGSYAIVVDGYDTGAYTLHVEGTYGNGAACDPTMPMFTCSVGYACTGVLGAATCQPADCNDTVDDDGDGYPGYPTDPGCTSASDGDETDDCPLGPNCPQCANGADDDGDTLVDYPADPACLAASGTNEECGTTDPVRLLTSGTLSNQSTTTLANDFDLACGSDGRDEVFRVVVDHPIDEIRVDTIGSELDTVIALRHPTCSGFDLQCDDDAAGNGDSEVFLIDPQLGEYFVVVDDRNVASPGTYDLRVQGHYAVGGRCNPANVFTCSPGFACTGAAGAELCTPTACSDTTDDDGDGFPGYPTDPGCASTSDGDETDNCPSGPGCPACSNDLDDDGDGATDYGMDLDCVAASGASEASCQLEAEPLLPITAVTTTGTTAGATSQFQPTCNANAGADVADRVHMLYVTRPLATLSLDTNDSPFDTVLSLYPSTCTGAPLACDDDGGDPDSESLISLTNVAPGAYAVVVDAYLGGGDYNLNVRGTYALGGACDSTVPMFTCSAGEACTGAAGAELCTPTACSDTTDDDGDGFPGYPSDPGCASLDDATETDNCPSGPGCPACSNDLDDDGDSRIDYLDDPACEAASGTTEAECAPEADPVLAVVAPATTATTTGATDTFEPSCQTSDSIDRVLLLTLPVAVETLTMNTHDSTMSDTIMMFMNATCGAEIECDDDDGDDAWSSIERTMVPAGTYAIVVDGYNGSIGQFTLNVSGTVAAGQACTSPLFAAGVLSCLGTCTAGVCQ